MLDSQVILDVAKDVVEFAEAGAAPEGGLLGGKDSWFGLVNFLWATAPLTAVALFFTHHIRSLGCISTFKKSWNGGSSEGKSRS